MNKVKFKTASNGTYKPGDLFSSDGIDDAEDLYILITFADYQYAAVSLQDGRLWENPQTTINEAVKGLDFIGRNMNIVISEV